MIRPLYKLKKCPAGVAPGNGRELDLIGGPTGWV